jgi:penicillin G amidase
MESYNRKSARTVILTYKRPMNRMIFCKLLVGVLLSSLHSVAGPRPEYGNIELFRDSWGVPHLFSDTDAGAMYGLGFATAEDRGFQMTYNLRLIQGRLSEVIGEVKMLNRNETSLDHDRKMRTFGFYRAAQRTASNLDRSTLALLEAYAEGVNDSFAAQRAAGNLHPLFQQVDLRPEPWTPADSLAAWWHLAQFFATDGTRDLVARRNSQSPARDGAGRGGPPSAPSDVKPLPPDDGPAVVKRADVPPEWIERVHRYARERGLSDDGNSSEGPKFSHAWVVGGRRTTTGSSVLVSDPQTPVRNPSMFYHFHIQGKTFNARGLGIPGSPGILIGFTDRVAWGVTALGADQADLFLLQTDPARPDQYRFDGEWRRMRVHRETIKIKRRDSLEWVVRETHLGPVATAFCFARPEEGEVALKRVPVCETDRETIQGALAMMRARDAREFDHALSGWRFPSVNILFGDRDGNIGYRTLAAIPVRSRLDPSHGRMAAPGHGAKHDWQEILPYDLLPHVMNPSSGFLYSGNHRPVESWYSIPLGAGTGTGGDTVRSWRLRERLEAKEMFTPEAVRDIHYDAVNPARRDIVRIGLHLRDALHRKLSEDALKALEILEPWHAAGASSALTSEGGELALELNTFFRFANTDLAHAYGGGEGGLAYFLKTATARIEADSKADFSPVEQHYIEESLAGAWRSARQKYGNDPELWNRKAREAVGTRNLGYFESLDGFPSLDRSLDLPFPALTVTDPGTIASQAAQAYTQWVPMHDPDQALAILPIGQSERPGSPARTSTMDLWAKGEMHPAPLSRQQVEKITVSRRSLERAAQTGTGP